MALPETNPPLTPNSQLRRDIAAARANRLRDFTAQPQQLDNNGSDDPPPWLDPVLQGQGGGASSSVLGRRQRESSPEGAVVLRNAAQPPPPQQRHIDLTAMAEELNGRPGKRLKSGTTSDLLYFARAREQERALLQYHATLQLLDTQYELIALSKQWSMPKELKANISLFTIATLLSPSITSYRNLLVPAVLDLLQRDGSLPAQFFRNPARCQTVSRAIQSAATNHRSTIKKKFVKSVSAKWCIGKLATALATKTDLKITSVMLQRFAFIRFQYVNAPSDENDAKGKGFWKHVSKKLAQAADDLQDPEEYAMMMKTYLTRDEELYKTGSKKKIRLYSATELPDFQTDADEVAKEVVLSALEEDEDLDAEADGNGGNDPEDDEPRSDHD